MSRPTNLQRQQAIAEAFAAAEGDLMLALESLKRVQQYLNGPGGGKEAGREIALSITKAQEALMWFRAGEEARAA